MWGGEVAGVSRKQTRLNRHNCFCVDCINSIAVPSPTPTWRAASGAWPGIGDGIGLARLSLRWTRTCREERASVAVGSSSSAS